MNKKLIITLVMIGILAFGAGLGSYAYFTSTATSNNNLFETGTLKIGVDSPFVTTAQFENIYPSWTSENTSYTVRNEGSLDLKYRLRVEPLVGNLLYDGTYPLQVSINGGAFQAVNAVQNIEIGTIAAGTNGSLSLQFKLPELAGNTYQDQSANFTFVFEATQTNNPGWNEAGLQ